LSVSIPSRRVPMTSPVRLAVSIRNSKVVAEMLDFFLNSEIQRSMSR
jgi:hypothetical protein